ncbi:hypothetical protein llg_41540 [Luteolibacter sp. LG18]|nr:hypothetical protein llg_41540 [Luteolibacter sp. LG18]
MLIQSWFTMDKTAPSKGSPRRVLGFMARDWVGGADGAAHEGRFQMFDARRAHLLHWSVWGTDNGVRIQTMVKMQTACRSVGVGGDFIQLSTDQALAIAGSGPPP